jgi:hypothetical protein
MMAQRVRRKWDGRLFRSSSRLSAKSVPQSDPRLSTLVGSRGDRIMDWGRAISCCGSVAANADRSGIKAVPSPSDCASARAVEGPFLGWSC